MPPPVAADALLLGVGDLGSRIGLLLAGRGLDVVGVRRNADRVPEPIRPFAADLTDEGSLALPTAELLVVCLTADGRDEEAYRRTYVTGMTRALDALRAAPRRAVLVSSSGVYGDRDDVLDEDSPTQPTRATGRVLEEAEKAFASRIPGATVARMSGIYGTGRAGRLVEQVRHGEDPDPGRWSNRIHEEDAAAAVVHLLTMPSEPAPAYVVTDDAPTPIGEVRAYLASLLGVPWTRTDATPHGKRLTNARLRATGFAPTHPSYREGYAALSPERAG